MKIIFSPIRFDTPLDLERNGDVLTINGEVFDFSAIPPGATLPRDAIASDWFAGDVERDDAGSLTIRLLLPHGANAPEETCFPAPLEVTVDGPVALPPYEVIEEET